jgi:hypothetical protein
MAERVSRRRREAARVAASRLLDPKYREGAAATAEGIRPVVIALWNDPLDQVLSLVVEEGAEARICVRTPNGGLRTLDVKGSAEPLTEAEKGEEVTAAPAATIGMLLDSLRKDQTSFTLALYEPSLRRFNFALAS